MGKWNTLAKVLLTVMREPSSLVRVLVDEGKGRVRRTHKLPNGLPTVDLLDLFPDFAVTVRPYSFLEGTSTVLDIALLNAFAARLPDCSYLEIGTWRGESLANVARYAKRCTSISLSPGEMRALGWSENIVRPHQFYSRDLANARHIGHNSLTFDFTTLGEKFDLIFVDGDHTYAGVRSDTENAFKLLRDEHSVIVWHDAGTTPENTRWSTLAGMLDGCPPEFRRHLYRVSNTLCAVFLREAPLASHPPCPRMPDKDFELTIKMHAL